MNEWIGRAEALGLLGVKPQTLYAYVSRGLIEVRRETDARRSLYRMEDVATLAGRRGRSRRPSAIAASSMSWGEPSIVTAISTVHRGRLIYRGLDAADFSRSATLEAAAQLLWDNQSDVVFAVPTIAADNGFLALAALVPESEASIGRSSELPVLRRTGGHCAPRRRLQGAPGRQAASCRAGRTLVAQPGRG